MNSLALVYEAPNPEVLKIGARAGDVSIDAAEKVWRAMIANAMPTIVAAQEMESLTLNQRSCQVMTVIDGLARESVSGCQQPASYLISNVTIEVPSPAHFGPNSASINPDA